MLRSLAFASALVLSAAAPAALAQSGSTGQTTPPATTAPQTKDRPTQPPTGSTAPSTQGQTPGTQTPGQTTPPSGAPRDGMTPNRPPGSTPPDGMGGVDQPPPPSSAPGQQPMQRDSRQGMSNTDATQVMGSCRTRRAEGETCSCLKAPTVMGISTAPTNGGRNMCVTQQ